MPGGWLWVLPAGFQWSGWKQGRRWTCWPQGRITANRWAKVGVDCCSDTSSFFSACICVQGEAGSPGENGVPGSMVRLLSHLHHFTGSAPALMIAAATLWMANIWQDNSCCVFVGCSWSSWWERPSRSCRPCCKCCSHLKSSDWLTLSMTI